LGFVIKEIFKTLQGEGALTGRAAVFCRFSGCNLWSGREDDRATATCRFCDTDFVGSDGDGGGRFTSVQAVADAIAAAWGPGLEGRFVVFTGGEPLLQLDAELVEAVRAKGFFTAIETNGTLAAPTALDWICVSPKAGAVIRQTAGQELKLVFPQPGAAPEQFEGFAFQHFFLQPMDGPERARNTEVAVAYCLAHPRWRISLQTHKLMGIP
jgi:7-carboxy-7-deazaguanine synthase (Cx14CxxC type)